MRAKKSRFGMFQLWQADGLLPIDHGAVDRPDMTQSVQRDIRAEIFKQDRLRLEGDKRPFFADRIGERHRQRSDVRADLDRDVAGL